MTKMCTFLSLATNPTRARKEKPARASNPFETDSEGKLVILEEDGPGIGSGTAGSSIAAPMEVDEKKVGWSVMVGVACGNSINSLV